MPMTVPGVCRFTLLGRWTNGRQWANVLDYQIDTTGSTENRPNACAVQAADIINNWQTQIRPFLTNNVIVTGIRLLDLDDEDGLTGEVPPNVGQPTAGGLAGASTTPNVSFLVRKVIIGNRSSRSGRMYLPGVQEASVDEDGVISGTGVDDLQDGLSAFLTNTNNAGTPTTHSSNLVVVHLEPRPAQPLPDDRVGTFTIVQALVLDELVATQRRRLR